MYGFDHLNVACLPLFTHVLPRMREQSGLQTALHVRRLRLWPAVEGQRMGHGFAEQTPQMNELIVNFHGLGEAPAGTSAAEQKYWLPVRAFRAAVDSVCAAASDYDENILITFDDGNMSDALIALPILASCGLKAEFFVCAGRIGARHYLDRAAIAELVEAGMEIGSHGMNHVDWRQADNATLDLEISGARRQLEDACGRRVDKAAIPFGSYDRRVIARLKSEKLEAVYTSDGGYARSDDWLKPRNTIDRTQQAETIIDEIRRHDTLATRLKRNVATFYKARCR